ncbi:hypothetical protein JB92DRAFT_1626546 [Gautieria morchelliformis]|nr:hypothetical protein JB92DRAFT_1626546 [Gautieria morchelliformis]
MRSRSNIQYPHVFAEKQTTVKSWYSLEVCGSESAAVPGVSLWAFLWTVVDRGNWMCIIPCNVLVQSVRAHIYLSIYDILFKSGGSSSQIEDAHRSPRTPQ